MNILSFCQIINDGNEYIVRNSAVTLQIGVLDRRMTLASITRSPTLSTDTKICKTCDAVLSEIERINDDAERFGVRFVKNGERAVAKKLLGITQFPALAYYR